jgi:Fe-S cluster assembly protein SufD
MQSVDQNIQWYQSKFKAFEQSLNGEKSTTMHAVRRDAIRRFAQNGFPTTRQEEWRFTNISPITKIEFQPILRYELQGIAMDDIRKYLLDGAVHAVFVNGMFSSELSDIGTLPPEVVVGSLAEILKNHPEKVQPYIAHLVKGEENAFTALNTAFVWDGGFISIPKGRVIDRPIQFLFVASDHKQAYAAQPRNLIVAGENSKCKVIETYVGLAQNTYLTNTVTEIVLEENSHLEHDKLQIENVNAFHIGTTQLQMNAASHYNSNAISLGGSLVRNNITAVFNAEGSECTLNGLTLSTGTQIIDNHTAIDHAKPHCNSHELYKAILDGESKGVFNGKIFVRKDAQNTDAKQTNKTLLLSDNATINAKPQLEIFADDVKCTHGATIGQLDDEQLFYLRSRGIDLAAARDILTFAFAGDVINRITIEPLREQVEKMIHDRLDFRQTGISVK